MTTALTDRTIVLGVSGSIAAYKAADLASQLGRLGADVHVVLTAHASEFVGPATFRALTRNPVLCGVFDEPHDRQIAHIQLAQHADLILVAPATANVLAKMACGIADDMLTTLLLAATAPVMVAPAMNTVMLDHPATQHNLQTLHGRGVQVIDPAWGVLACQVEGRGKLAAVETLVDAVVQRLAHAPDLAGVRVLVTAGATREPIDPVRFVSNRSSGKMGYAVAEAARARGAAVTLVSAHASVPVPDGVDLVGVETTAQMLDACREPFARCDVLLAAAAPADYAPVEVADAKISKSEAGPLVTLHLRETPDVVASLAASRRRQVVVGFAAETGDAVARAADKLRRKGLDLVVANDVTAEGAGFDVDTNIVTLVRRDGSAEALPRLPKREVADRVLDAVVPLLSSSRP